MPLSVNYYSDYYSPTLYSYSKLLAARMLLSPPPAESAPNEQAGQ